MNAVFRRLMDGAALVGMHRNLYWKTARGWELDSGAFLAGLEQAAGITADDLRQAGVRVLRRRPVPRWGSRPSGWRWSATTS